MKMPIVIILSSFVFVSCLEESNQNAAQNTDALQTYSLKIYTFVIDLEGEGTDKSDSIEQTIKASDDIAAYAQAVTNYNERTSKEMKGQKGPKETYSTGFTIKDVAGLDLKEKLSQQVIDSITNNANPGFSIKVQL